MAIPPPPPPPSPEPDGPGFWKRVIAPPPPEPGHPQDFTREVESWLDDHRAAKTAVYLAGLLLAFVVVAFVVTWGGLLLRGLFGWLPDLF